MQQQNFIKLLEYITMKIQNELTILLSIKNYFQEAQRENGYLTLKSAPFSSNKDTSSRLPLDTATNTGVCPNLSRTCTSAPSSMSNLATSKLSGKAHVRSHILNNAPELLSLNI